MVDVIVIGGGHAGVEAALACARLKKTTILYSMHIDMIASMPCNPSVGGPAKGIVVREIDALGGEMGKAADATALQFKMLNTTKGPGVQCLRVQSDKLEYKRYMQDKLLQQEHLEIREMCVEEVLAKDGRISGVRQKDGTVVNCRALIMTTGTFMSSTVLVGHTSTLSGPEDEPTTENLSQSLRNLGIETFRLKTGTPARVRTASIDFSKTAVQPGTDEFICFSEDTKEIRPFDQQAVCYLTYTTAKTHDIINSNLKRSAMYSGLVKGVGPRYCPSIETKIVTFPDKPQHQLFLEPEGETTQELYLNGFSSSLPMDIQLAALKKVPAFKDLVVYRPGYAIEYDYFDPTQLKHTLESKIIKNLFLAGQVNGTTGYEEAGGQGIIAGINAHINCHGGEPFTLGRDEAYIGVLIDDLVTKGVDEPYRMFTSRAEYRILLRQDDADMRLTERAYKLGLVKQDRYEHLCSKREAVSRIIDFAKTFSIKAALINDALESLGTARLTHGCKLIDLLNRPQITIENIAGHIPAFKALLDQITDRKEEVIEAAEVLIKYQGYIDRERMIADKIHRLEAIRIKGKFDYNSLNSLSTEARQKLMKIDPETLAQASRIPGISPSDINVLLVLLGR